jgi:hypothetical protein
MKTICDQMIDAEYELAWWQYEQSLREEAKRIEEEKKRKEAEKKKVKISGQFPMYPFGSWDGFESSYDAARSEQREIYNS